MESLYWFASAAWIAAIFKILILAQSRTASKPAAAFNILTLALISQNVCEGFSYFFFSQGSNLVTQSGTGVIISMSVLSAAVVHFTVTITAPKNGYKYIAAFWTYSAALVLAACFGYLVIGVELAGHSLKTIRAPLYSIFSLNIIASIFAASRLLWIGSKSETYVVQIRSKLVMLAFAPLFLTGLVVVGLGLASIPSSSGLYMPFASTFLVLVLMKGQQEDDQIISFRLKWLQVWFHLRQALKAVDSKGPIGLQEFNEYVRTIQLVEAMKYCRNNRSAVARLLKSNQTSISRAWSKIQSEEGALKNATDIEAIKRESKRNC
ncbi:MAG: hypothetical protein ACJA2Q_002648 [Pseudohongiellaceae bacterium]|jgi:hypothetical protein